MNNQSRSSSRPPPLLDWNRLGLWHQGSHSVYTEKENGWLQRQDKSIVVKIKNWQLCFRRVLSLVEAGPCGRSLPGSSCSASLWVSLKPRSAPAHMTLILPISLREAQGHRENSLLHAKTLKDIQLKTKLKACTVPNNQPFHTLHSSQRTD